jgi:hypothetical protein
MLAFHSLILIPTLDFVVVLVVVFVVGDDITHLLKYFIIDLLLQRLQ